MIHPDFPTPRVRSDMRERWLTYSAPVTLDQAHKYLRMRAQGDGARTDHMLTPRAHGRVVPAGHEGFSLRLAGGRVLPLRWHAARQLCSAAGVHPRQFYELDEFTALEVLNRGLRTRPRPLRLRLAGDEVRAIVSARYAPCDDERLLSHVDDALRQVGRRDQARVRNLVVGPRTLLRITFPDQARTILPGDDLEHGFDLLNSELGIASVSIMPITYRLLCTNGMRGWVRLNRHRIRHVGDVARVQHAVRATLTAALDDSSEQAHLMGRAAQLTVPSAEAELQRLQQAGLRPGLLTAVRRELAAELQVFADSPQELSQALRRQVTVYDLVNAFTAAARGSRHAAGRLREEALAHRYLMDKAA